MHYIWFIDSRKGKKMICYLFNCVIFYINLEKREESYVSLVMKASDFCLLNGGHWLAIDCVTDNDISWGNALCQFYISSFPFDLF